MSLSDDIADGEIREGARFSDVLDAEDPRFRVITMRLPVAPHQVGTYDGGIQTVFGDRAVIRIERTMWGLGAGMRVLDPDVAHDRFSELLIEEAERWPCPSQHPRYRSVVCGRALDHHGDHIAFETRGDDQVVRARWPRG